MIFSFLFIALERNILKCMNNYNFGFELTINSKITNLSGNSQLLNSKTISFTPTNALIENLEYELTIDSNLSDLAGNSPTPQPITFTYTNFQTAFYTKPDQRAEISITSYNNFHLFQGREFDKELDLYYFRNRYLDKNIGIWITQDPQNYEDSYNLYQLLKNNYINNADPFGKYIFVFEGEKYAKILFTFEFALITENKLSYDVLKTKYGGRLRKEFYKYFTAFEYQNKSIEFDIVYRFIDYEIKNSNAYIALNPSKYFFLVSWDIRSKNTEFYMDWWFENISGKSIAHEILHRT